MSSLDAPLIESFEPTRTYHSVGHEYLRLENTGGVTLDLSETGIAEADQDPRIASLLARMGDFIAEHEGYKGVRAVSAVEPGRIPRIAEPPNSYRRGRRLATIYHHDSTPTAIIKAYDLDRRTAAFQFYLGNWLHSALDQADDGLHSVPQFARFTAPGTRTHQTVVMGYAPGESLDFWEFSRKYTNKYETEAVEAAADTIHDKARQKAQATLGWRGKIIANDLHIRGNIILGDPDAPLADMLEQDLTIIDQPVVKWHLLPKLALARYVPVIGAEPEPEPSIITA